MVETQPCKLRGTSDAFGFCELNLRYENEKTFREETICSVGESYSQVVYWGTVL